jgi:hypothetical protein
MDAKIMLPGVPSMPTLIYEERDAYIDALRAADARQREGEVDVSEMTAFLRRMLTQQLARAIDALAGPPR